MLARGLWPVNAKMADYPIPSQCRGSLNVLITKGCPVRRSPSGFAGSGAQAGRRESWRWLRQRPDKRDDWG